MRFVTFYISDFITVTVFCICFYTCYFIFLPICKGLYIPTDSSITILSEFNKRIFLFININGITFECFGIICISDYSTLKSNLFTQSFITVQSVIILSFSSVSTHSPLTHFFLFCSLKLSTLITEKHLNGFSENALPFVIFVLISSPVLIRLIIR